MRDGEIGEPAQARCRLKWARSPGEGPEFGMIRENTRHRFRIKRIRCDPYQPFLLIEMRGHQPMPVGFYTGYRSRTGSRIIVIGHAPGITRYYQRGMVFAR